MRSMVKPFLVACYALFSVLPLVAQEQPSSADLDAGRQLYLGRCGHCHGQSGEGGRGAVLNAGRYRHGNSDREIYTVIRRGIPNTEMPGTASLPEAEVWRIVAHVKRLSQQGSPEPPVGDPTTGAAVYQKNGCANCHTIQGKGGIFGPDLTDVGSKRAVRHLRESILNPNADIPLDYRSVKVTATDGKSTNGIHLNEDEYSIQLRDLSGNLRTFLKSELKQVELSRESLMPAYPSLSDTDRDNLVAYLSSLRSTP